MIHQSQTWTLASKACYYQLLNFNKNTKIIIYTIRYNERILLFATGKIQENQSIEWHNWRTTCPVSQSKGNSISTFVRATWTRHQASVPARPGYLQYHSPINSDSFGISCASPGVIYIAANQIRAPFFREALAP